MFFYQLKCRAVLGIIIIGDNMKNKKGFTLVELLAVIAILAILVIIALPNVMGMFRTAKKNSFETEVKNIYKVAQQQWMMDSMMETKDQVYSRCSTCTGKQLSLSGRQELDYYIKLDKSGKVVNFYATDGTYQFSYDGDLLATQINDVEEIAKLSEDEILKITDRGAYTGDGPKLVETTEQKTEGVLSAGDEVVIANKEHFYVVSSDTSKTTLIAKYNLYVGFNVKSNPNGSGTVLDGKISTSDSRYGWQSAETVSNSNIALVPYSGKKYWQDPTNENKFVPEDGDFFDESTYNKSLSTVEPVVTDVVNSSNYSVPKVAESDYSIAYYVEPYLNKIRGLGVNVLGGGVISHSQISAIGGGYSSSSWRGLGWLTNSRYWTGSVYWHGRVNWQQSLVGLQGGYSPSEYNAVTIGVRPTITISTSDIQLLPHSYFENQPVIIH